MSGQPTSLDRPLRTGVIMDPIGGINIRKDSTFAMMLEAQRRGHDLLYMEPSDVWVDGGEARASWRQARVEDNPEHWFDLGERQDGPLAELDVLLMRRDPPFDMDYVYLTYALELAEAAGTDASQVMDEAGLARFIQHFERITRHNLATLPAVADVVLELDEGHAVSRATSIRIAKR